VIFPTGPNQVTLPLIFEKRRVDRPTVVRFPFEVVAGVKRAFEAVFRERVVVFRNENVSEVVLVFTVVRREVDVKATVEEVNFRRPKFAGVRALFRRGPNGARAARLIRRVADGEDDLAFRVVRFAPNVLAAELENPRVGAFANEDRFRRGASRRLQ
jgi:hypothetical protein